MYTKKKMKNRNELSLLQEKEEIEEEKEVFICTIKVNTFVFTPTEGECMGFFRFDVIETDAL